MATNVQSTGATDPLYKYGSTSRNTGSNEVNTAEDAQSRFLKLLVTQLKNQDPLNPLDNAQMTSQLAQMSTVSGIEKLNSTLSGLVDSLGNSQTMQASAMIGKKVLVPGNKMLLNAGIKPDDKFTMVRLLKMNTKITSLSRAYERPRSALNRGLILRTDLLLRVISVFR